MCGGNRLSMYGCMCGVHVCVCACVCACVCVSVSMEMGQWRKSGTLLVHSDQTQIGKAGQEEPVTIKRKKDNKMIKPRINKRR